MESILPQQWKYCLIRPLPKPKKYPTQPQGYHPVKHSVQISVVHYTPGYFFFRVLFLLYNWRITCIHTLNFGINRTYKNCGGCKKSLHSTFFPGYLFSGLPFFRVSFFPGYLFSGFFFSGLPFFRVSFFPFYFFS